MRSRGPLITLLAGLALAGMLISLSVNASREADLTGGRVNAPAAEGGAADNPADVIPEDPEPEAEAEAEAEEEPAAEPDGEDAEGEDGAPAAPAGNLNVTWAGRVKGNSKATVAITAKGDKAIAYVCDGNRIEVWLQGSATDGELDLSAKDGTDTLTGTYGGGRAEGTITVDGKEFTFDVGKASKPSGLYRTAADVRGAKLVGGWIVLADGTQVGLASFAGSTVPVSRLDVESRTATFYGARVTAKPAAPGAAW